MVDKPKKERKVKTVARRDRTWPSSERVISTNFPDGFNQVAGSCYVPLEDFRKLQRKYIKLFKRYQDAVEHNRLKASILHDMTWIMQLKDTENDTTQQDITGVA